MNGNIIILLLLLVIPGLSPECSAQVRVKRAHTKKFEHRPKRKSKTDEDTPSPRKKKKDITTRIKAASIPELRNTLDATFYVKWKTNRKLVYSDFQYNRNLYNKFLPASDTDLTRVIYPEYSEFYRRLSERHHTEQKYEDSIWNIKADLMLHGGMQSKESVYETESIDSAAMMRITVDSPAASVINILPVIYAVGSNSYYYNITVLFSKRESWMIVKAKDILEHEQIHFDIFELYARKMRRHLIETIRENYKEGTPHEITDDIAPGFEQLYQQLNNLQLEFDRQTAAFTATNSSLARTNAIWQRAMQQQLEQLKEYALPEGTIILN